MHNDYFYDMNEYPLRKLLPLHWFIEINREEVVQRIECVVSDISEKCYQFDEKKCTIYDVYD